MDADDRESMEEVLKSLYDVSRPSAAKLYDRQRRAGHRYTRAAVNAFVRSQPVAQRFAAPVKEQGHIVALSLHALYQMDLIDMSRYSPPDKKALKWIFVALRAFDRRFFAVPLATKHAGTTVFGLRRVIEQAGGTPQVCMTDNGTEYQGEFAAAIEEFGIEHRTNMPGDHRAMGLVDRAIQTLRTMINKWMEANNSTEWWTALDDLVEEYNSTGHQSLHGQAPDDVEDNAPLTQQLRVDNAVKLFKNACLRRNRIRVGDKFRAPLQRGLFSRGFTPKFSGHVYTVEKIYRGFVESEGLLFKKRDVLRVPDSATDVQPVVEQGADAHRAVGRARRQLSRLDPEYIWGNEQVAIQDTAQRRAQRELTALDPAYDFG